MLQEPHGKCQHQLASMRIKVKRSESIKFEGVVLVCYKNHMVNTNTNWRAYVFKPSEAQCSANVV